MAHSAGAAMVADMLAEGRAERDWLAVRAVFLLAPPYIGRDGWDFGEFDFDAHRERPPSIGMATFFYFGDRDTTVPPTHAKLYRDVFPRAAFRQISDCDHQFAGRLLFVAQDIKAVARSLGLGSPTQ